MPRMRTMRTCVDRVVPTDLLASSLAIDLKTARLTTSDLILPSRFPLVRLKAWSNGFKLRCRFLDGSDSQRAKVVEKAKVWLAHANVSIVFTDDPDSEIRISFEADQNSWSAVGTDCLISAYFHADQPTMNLGWLNDDTDDQEYERVVAHQFGHALGLTHQIESPRVHLNWDIEAVYKTFSGPPNNWSKAEIDHNILQKYSPRGISAARFDAKSIMLYQFDGSLFTDGRGTPLNVHLSDADQELVRTIYPRERSESAAKTIRESELTEQMRIDEAKRTASSRGAKPGELNANVPISSARMARLDTKTSQHKSEPRFVNACITRGSAQVPVPKSRGLRPRGRYALRLDIGPWSRNSAVTNPVPVPTEKLPAAEDGHWLEVIAVSDDFLVKKGRYHIFLPKTGAAFLCRCRPGGPHICKNLNRTSHLFISIIAPSLNKLVLKTLASSHKYARLRRPNARPARLRLAIYFQKNLVQSLLLTASVGLKDWRGGGYSFKIDYSLTAHLSDLDFLPHRTLNILTNDNPDGNHKLIFNGDTKSPIAFNLNDQKMGEAIAAARQTLKDISVKEYGGQLGAKIQYESKYDKNNEKSRDDFIADLRLLAPLGWKLWLTLFQTQPEARTELSARLRSAPIRPATIQISRVMNSSLTFPWGFIYDIPLEADTRRHVLCRSLSTVNISDIPDHCPFEQQHPKKNIICPFGFWGFNHIIEQPPSVPLGRALPTLIRKAETHSKAQLVMGVSLDLDVGVTQVHTNNLERQLAGLELIPKNSRDEIETALAQEELELVYFYCHGRREALAGNKATTPFIEIGKKEGIAPGDITAWQIADWKDTHWKKTSPLVFINGCHTAELTPDLLVNFVDSFIGVYASGVIGTEILLLQEVASEAAEQFLVAINSKNPLGDAYVGVGQAIRKMRLHFLGKGNLLGLAYTPYCSADLKLSD